MKILLVHDVDNWSFHNIGRNLAALAGPDGRGVHQFRLMSRADWAGRPKDLLAALEWADLHVFFWRFDLLAAIEMLGARRRDHQAVARLIASKITLSIVYDHLYDSPQALAEMGNPFAFSDLNAVCSGSLARHYAAQPHLFTPDAVLIDGVDLEVFTPATRPPNHGLLRVGWVGNSAWGRQVGPDMKGFHTIFQPAIADMAADGRIAPHIADRTTNPVAPEDMPEFYRQIDVLACTSAIEGTPNPVLEAMAAGAAVVSTDVGVVRDVLGPEQQAFIIPRDPENLRHALARLADDRALLGRLRAENLARRNGLSWQARLDAWLALFDQAEATLADPARIKAKKARLLTFLATPKSRLAQVRRHVMANRFSHDLYMRMLGRYPDLMARLRKQLRGKAPSGQHPLP